ncbi:uncharacterized protein LOC110035719 [Phalaenopsis equestris]|uniref:uncharacterized protein LOC110035719 n=1 Tax=Phalaenopsis equestris TaxID=78828 RepID=UPI0009E5E9A5|nr:uncharacterized protein LOC110035719 [Phalaenopsis equestris]
MVGSEHMPLLCTIKNVEKPNKAPFRFQNMWTLHRQFFEEVDKVWRAEDEASKKINQKDTPVIEVPDKKDIAEMKLLLEDEWKTQKSKKKKKLSLLHLKTSKALRKWGWETFENVFSNALSADKEVEKLEAAVQNNTAIETDLLSAQTNLLNAIVIQDMLLKQKSYINIFTEGDRNTKFYHAYISYKRKCNTIHSTEGRWINENEFIALDVVKYYSSQLNSLVDLNIDYEDYFLEELNYTNQLNLTEPPSDEEIWDALKTIDSSKAGNADGFTADLYKKAWHIIKKGVFEAIRSFFREVNLPSYFGDTSIVLIPKGDLQKTWEHYSPISLTSVISKLISKIIVRRLQPHLDRIICPNQTGLH